MLCFNARRYVIPREEFREITLSWDKNKIAKVWSQTQKVFWIFFGAYTFCILSFSTSLGPIDKLGDLIFSKIWYASNIDVHPFVLDQNQIIEAYEKGLRSVVQKPSKELKDKEVYLALFLKDKYKNHFAGTLISTVEGIPRPISVVLSSNNMAKNGYALTIVPLGKYSMNGNGSPEIKIGWSSMSVQKIKSGTPKWDGF